MEDQPLVADFKETVRTLSVMIEKQRGALQPVQLMNVLQGLGDSLECKAATLPFIKPAVAEGLCTVINESPLGDIQKGKIVTLVLNRVDVHAPDQKTIGHAKCQVIAEPWRFVTHNDVKQLQDPARPAPSKCALVCERMRLLGCTHPTEDSYGKITAVVAYYHCRDGTTEQLYALLQEMKKCFDSKKSEATKTCRMKKYPDSPQLLPEAIFHASYTDPEDPPAEVQDFAGIQVVAAAIPLRLTHRRLRASASSASSAQMQLLPAAASIPASAASPAMGMLQLMQAVVSNPQILSNMVQGLQGMHLHQQQQARPQPNITFFGSAGQQQGMQTEEGSQNSEASWQSGTPPKPLPASSTASVFANLRGGTSLGHQQAGASIKSDPQAGAGIKSEQDDADAIAMMERIAAGAKDHAKAAAAEEEAEEECEGVWNLQRRSRLQPLQ